MSTPECWPVECRYERGASSCFTCNQVTERWLECATCCFVWRPMSDTDETWNEVWEGAPWM